MIIFVLAGVKKKDCKCRCIETGPTHNHLLVMADVNALRHTAKQPIAAKRVVSLEIHIQRAFWGSGKFLTRSMADK